MSEDKVYNYMTFINDVTKEIHDWLMNVHSPYSNDFAYRALFTGSYTCGMFCPTVVAHGIKRAFDEVRLSEESFKGQSYAANLYMFVPCMAKILTDKAVRFARSAVVEMYKNETNVPE